MNIKQAKKLIGGCGRETLQFVCGAKPNKNIMLCPSCQRAINQMKSGAEYFLGFLERISKILERNNLTNLEGEIATIWFKSYDKVNTEITKLKKIIEVLEG